ncbi:MAG: ATP-binding protein [Candidatus Omnitrophota bacterium]|jgi:tRNA 2-thiocytidine biosynthesis protein TtcA
MRQLTKTGSYISNRIGRAIADYNLIEDKDRILIAVSGGKDSLSLLRLLNERRKWAPVNYKLIAVHVESDYKGGCGACKSELKKIFKKEGVEHHFEKIKILDKKRKVNCFWCSWNRRKALFTLADKFRCNKVALGHHMDDILETLLLNIFYHGEFAAMNPRQELFKGKIVIIRPLCYAEEKHLKRFAIECGFKAQVSTCPNAETSKRRVMKNFIKKLEEDCSYVKTNIFKSVSRVKEEYIKL